jgi:hypothetical protein
MKRMLIAAAAACLAISGPALAQQTNATPSTADTSRDGNSTGTDYLKDPAMVGSFYTDDTMTTLRPVEEMRTAFMAMTPEDQAGMKLQCEQEETRGSDATALCSEVANF